MSINEEILKYSIQLSFDGSNGSGVIFKPFEESNYCYIFTARHTFEKKEKYDKVIFYLMLRQLSTFQFIDLLISRIQSLNINFFFDREVVHIVIKP